jgi:hypothetical protein
MPVPKVACPSSLTLKGTQGHAKTLPPPLPHIGSCSACARAIQEAYVDVRFRRRRMRSPEALHHRRGAGDAARRLLLVASDLSLLIGQYADFQCREDA